MRQRFLFSLLAVATSLSLQALDWPAGSNVSLEFGGPNVGAPLQGLVLSGSDMDVRAADAGELSFERSARDGHTRLPSAMGDTLVLEGRDGIASVYSYLPAMADPGATALVAGALIAKSGSAGLLDGPGFMFGLYDRKSDRWVNPRVFLPKREDERAPLIRRVSLVSGGRTWILGDQKSIPQGSYAIVVETAEQETGGAAPVPGPPWYLRVLSNGEKVAELKTEIATVKDGRLSFYPEVDNGADFVAPDGSVRLPPRQFARGKVSIEVLVRDFAGNERSMGWTLLVE